MFTGSNVTADEALYTGLRVIGSEGGVRVGLISCLLCGCALTLDTEDGADVVKLHIEWHRSQGRGRRGATEHTLRVGPLTLTARWR